MKVMMATDGSVHASAAMLAASRVLRLSDAGVDVVSVASLPPARPLHDQPQSSGAHVLGRRLIETTRTTLDEAQRVLAQAHVQTQAVLETGSPADRLLALAPNYDITVVGAYGNHDRKQPGLGPVASQLLQASRGNVFIGRELANNDNFRVLVAVDDSEASATALRTIGTLFDPSSFEVTAMHVIELPRTNTNDAAERQLEQELRQTANSLVQSALDQLERWSVPAKSIIAEGDPVQELCSKADEGGYDLVIAGATGASDVKHALLGNVSLKLAWDAPCSVAVIRRAVS